MRLTVASIRQVVADVTGISEADILSPRRDGPIVRARQIVMWASRTYSGRGVTAIGRLLNRDHTTVLYGAATIQAEVDGGNVGADILQVAAAIETAAASLDIIEIADDDDIDPLDVARTVLASPRRALGLTIHRLQAMAAYVVALAAADIDAPPADAEIMHAAGAVVAALSAVDAARYSRGEQAAAAALRTRLDELAAAWNGIRDKISSPQSAFKTSSKAPERSPANGTV